MRHSLHLAAALLLLIGATAHAQITNPDNLIAPTPRNPARARRPAPTDDLQYLWQYARPTPIGRANDLRLDARFQSLLHDDFHQPQSVWGSTNNHEPLATVIPLFLTQYGAVTATDNRYLTIDGCVPSFCAASGLLWIDLGRPHPLAVFAAVNWNPDAHTVDEPTADYNLYLFTDHPLDPDALPFALTQAIAHWNIRLSAAHRLVPHIAHALLIQPDGTPNPLDPAMVGANSISPQPDTSTPAVAEK
jgi:hypothetical protein